MGEQAHADNLKSSRTGSLKISRQDTKRYKKAAKELGSLMIYINPMLDWLFAIAFSVAILKDILDLVNTALIAAGGVGAILIFVFTTLASLTIGLIMLITGSTGKVKVARAIAKRFMLLLAATLAEYIPGVGILPIETIVVIVIIRMTLVERRLIAAQEKTQAQKSAAANQATGIA